jgi:hypothetical protein
MQQDSDAETEMPDAAAQEAVRPPLKFVEQQAAAAAIARVAAAAGGSPLGRSSQRRKPAFVQQRIPTPRKLHYKDSIAAVVTADEQQLFQELHNQQQRHNA